MDIMERVRKLFALSQRNENTNEAAAAAAKIQELCFQHNIELEAALAADPATKREEYQRIDYILPNTSRADVGWKRGLFYEVCKANFCTAVYMSGTFKLGVVGQRANFEVCTYEYEYLVKEIQRLAVTNCVQQAFIGGKDKRQYINGFCEGATASVRSTLKAAHTYQAQATGDARALMVVKDRQLDTATREHFPHIRRTRRLLSGSNTGIGDGRRVGQGITVNRGIGAQSHARLN